MASVQGTQGSERPEMMATWSPAVRTLRNITNSADIQQTNRPSNVAHVSVWIFNLQNIGLTLLRTLFPFEILKL